MKKKAQKVEFVHGESSVMRLIRERYSGSSPREDKAYVVLEQVRNSTGYGPRTRTADAIVMSLWPSRGLTLMGFEIKVSKSDWKSELAQPEKAEEISRFCDCWNIVAPPGIVELSELPPTWGLYEAHERKLKLVRAPVLEKEVQPISRGFLGALLRAATTGVVPVSEVESSVNTRVEREIEHRLQWAVDERAPEYKARERELETTKAHLASERMWRERFEAASGITISSYDGGRIGKAIDAIRWENVAEHAERLAGQAESYRRAADLAEAAAAELRAAPTVGPKKEKDPFDR